MDRAFTLHKRLTNTNMKSIKSFWVTHTVANKSCLSCSHKISGVSRKETAVLSSLQIPLELSTGRSLISHIRKQHFPPFKQMKPRASASWLLTLNFSHTEEMWRKHYVDPQKSITEMLNLVSRRIIRAKWLVDCNEL